MGTTDLSHVTSHLKNVKISLILVWRDLHAHQAEFQESPGGQGFAFNTGK